MAVIQIEPAGDGKLWVALTKFAREDLARLKAIPGRRWNPERGRWLVPDSPAARAALTEIVAQPPAPPLKMLAVKPRPHPNPSPVAKDQRQERGKGRRYVAGRDKPLTTNPPHPLIKQVDDELVLRGMAYGTRKSYGQHLRNYFNWLKDVTLKQRGKVGELPQMKRPQQLPIVLSRDEVARILKVTYHLKHKALLMTAYSAGLRVGEVVRPYP